LFVNIDPAVICAIITVSGTFASAFVSWFVSRYTTTKELEKLQLTWSREDSVSYEDEFSEMVSAVSKYIHTLNSSDCADAIGKIGAIRAKTSGELASKTDILYVAVFETGSCKYLTTQSVKKCLSETINQKRKSSRSS